MKKTRTFYVKGRKAIMLERGGKNDKRKESNLMKALALSMIYWKGRWGPGPGSGWQNAEIRSLRFIW